MSVTHGLALRLALLTRPLAQVPWRTALAMLAVALGVALGFAVQLIHGSALSEFEIAAREISGDADLLVRGSRDGFSVSWYQRISQMDEVEIASPVLETDVRVRGREAPLRIVGVDAFQLGRVQADLLPLGASALDLLRAESVFLSASIATELGLRIGDSVSVQIGLAAVNLRVAGLLGVAHQRVATMDIAAAQWKLQRPGKLTRIDLKLRAGADIHHFARTLQDQLPAGVVVEEPASRAHHAVAASRAYRVNLNVLALVALFTGGLMVYSTQSLSVARRRSEFALLRVLGVTRRGLLRMIVLEASLLGGAGAILGIALGWLIALLMLGWSGADLGAGYFADLRSGVHFDPWAALAYFSLGVVAAVAGSLPPALDCARSPPAIALRAGDDAGDAISPRALRAGVVLLALGGLFAFLPAVGGIPLFAYVAVACLLLGVITLLPAVVRFLLTRPVPVANVTPLLALRQLAFAPKKMAVGLAAIVAAVSLAVAMAIMVGSFRFSVISWLDRMLPADLYVRAGAGSEVGLFTPLDQRRIRAIEGVRTAEFLRVRQVLIDPRRAPITLLARDFLHADAARALPLVESPLAPDSQLPSLWVSEVAAGLLGWQAGMKVELPIESVDREFYVVGIWRDYARQNGALLIDRRDYIALTGDRNANDAGLWLDASTDVTKVARRVHSWWPEASGLETTTPGEVRALSLQVFDRSFAVTYALEGAAILIGLLALTGSVAAQLVTRRREFGMLRHLGMTRRQLSAMLIWEGAMVNAVGILIGCALGWVISLILIHVVNRQSFHWSMSVHMPWLILIGFALALAAFGVLAAAWAGRRVAYSDAVRAVKEDW